MTVALLVLIALVQGAFLVMLVLLVAIGRWLGVVRDRRRRSQHDRVGEDVRAWLAGEISSEALARTLNRATFEATADFLIGFSVRRGGEEWERLAAAVRETAWFRTLRRHARSVLWWRRLGAARLLSKLATPDDEALARRLLVDSRPPVRVAAAEIVSRIPSRPLMEDLYDFASSTGAVVRGHMLELLARNRDVLEEMLLERLAAASDHAAIDTALELAGQIGTPSLLPVVLAHVTSSELEDRIAAARALASFPHPRTSAALVRLLTDPEWEARAVAASSLGAIGAIEATDALRAALEDRSWWVRLRAAISLRLLGPTGVEVLRSVAAETDTFAYDMANYVLSLSDSAILEFVARNISSDPADAAGWAA